MIYFGYDYNGKEEYKLLGIRDDDGNVYDIIQILESNISVLDGNHDVKIALIGRTLDVQVLDSDDLLPFSMYKTFENLKNTKQISSVVPIDNYETENAKKWKIGFNNFLKRNKIVEATLNDFNRMFLQRYKFDRQNKNGGYITKHPDILFMDSVMDNCDDATRSYVGSFVKKLPEYKKRFENKPLTSEDQRIFFNAIDNAVMPNIEDVAAIDDDNISVYELKNMVPRFADLIGGYVNYRRGSEEGETGSYTSGEYIRNSDTARLLNSTNYKDILAGRTGFSESAYKQTVIGNRKIDITESYIIGDSDYDADGIRSNEEEYFNILKKFIDDCLEYDLTKAPITEWRGCGMRTVEHIPNLDMVAHRSFSETSYNTLQMVNEDSDDSFTVEKLAEYGITKESVKEECVGTPTANRWFKYAINVALMATRAYTGFVDVPFGYEQCDFDELEEMPRNTIDAKYSAYKSGLIWFDRRWMSADEYDGRINPDSENVTTFDDYGSIDGTRAYDYWYNVDSSSNLNNGNSVMQGFDKPNLLDSVIKYCKSSGNFYAMAEALIKCLRFGMKKPRCLQLEGVASRVDLTTTSLKMDVLRNEPVSLSSVNPDKIYAIGRIVILDHNHVSPNLKSAGEFKFSKSNKDIIIGVGLMARYKQIDGHEELITDYYDIETLIKNTDIHQKIANFKDGKLINAGNLTVDSITVESVQDVMANMEANSSTTSIVINDNIYSNVINNYLKKVENQNTKKKINALNRSGFNLFSMCRYLDKISNITMCIRLVGLGKDSIKLSSESSILNIENIMYVKALTLYGGLFNILLTSDISGSVAERFNKECEIWKNMDSYELSISVVNSSSQQDSSQSYFEMLKSKISKDDEYEIGIVVNGSNNLFYILQSKKTRKYIALNQNKLTASEAYELSRKPLVDGKKRVGKIKIEMILRAVTMTQKKSGKSAMDVVNMLFLFYDSETEKIVKNIITNSL